MENIPNAPWIGAPEDDGERTGIFEIEEDPYNDRPIGWDEPN